MITAIIAHKNYNEYLKDAINSCLSQTIKINYVVIDDGSTTPPEPPEWPIIKDDKYRVYGLNNDKFIYLKESVGPSLARNIAISECWDYTEYFQILDADDIMLPQKCERLLNNFDNNTGVVYGDYFIETDGVRKMEFKPPYSQNQFINECMVHSGSLISKIALTKVVENGCFFYDNQLRCAEDYDLFTRISEKMMIKHVPEFLTIVKEHKNNSTNTVSSNIWQQCLQRLHQKRIQRNAKY